VSHERTFADVLAANETYANGFSLRGLQARAAKGLAVLTCIDSRIEPLAMLGLRPGDAKILRNAGARVTDDALRSLVLAVNLLAVTRICVAVTSSGAPLGAQTEAPSLSTSGDPATRTRVAAVVKRPVTQGPLSAGGGGSGQWSTA